MTRRSILVTGLPEGTMSITRFMAITGVQEPVIARHIAEGHIKVTEATWGVRVCRYLTPDQQRRAMDYWDVSGVKYRKASVH